MMLCLSPKVLYSNRVGTYQSKILCLQRMSCDMVWHRIDNEGTEPGIRWVSEIMKFKLDHEERL